ALCDEITRLREQGVEVSPDNLRIAENAVLILPLHRELDEIRETSNTGTRIGTTKRGIGPAYEDKVGRRALRVMDLVDLDALEDKVEKLLAHHTALRKGRGKDLIDCKALTAQIKDVAPKILPYMDTVWRLLDGIRR